MPIQKSICLHSTADGAGKVYNIQIVEVPGGYEVHYQNGKRGGTLASGTKTRAPASLDSAAKIFNSLVNEKVNGRSHYKVIGTDANTAVTPVAERALSGVLPMLTHADIRTAQIGCSASRSKNRCNDATMQQQGPPHEGFAACSASHTTRR